MTSPRVEKQRQVTYTTASANQQRTVSSSTAPLLSFQNRNNTGLQVEHSGKQNQQYVQSYVRVKSKDGKTYNFNKTLENRINNVTAKLKKAEKENGLIGKVWSWTKNTIGFGDSSNKVREIQANERKLLAQFNANEKARANVFKQLTGYEYNEENLEKFIKGQIKLKSEIAIEKYKEGQEMAVDITSDIISGVVAFGVTTACIAGGIAAAPFTAGASLGLVAAGVGIGAAAGSVTKVAIKGGEALVGGKKYPIKQALKDAAIGAVSGALAPVTIGAGGAIANSVGRVAPKFIATTARLSVEGATFGAADGGVRSALEGDSIGEVGLNTLKGAGIGALAGNVFGHGGNGIKTGISYTKNAGIKKIKMKLNNVLRSKSSDMTNYMSQDIYNFIDDFCIKNYGDIFNSQERKLLFDVITNNGNKTIAKQRMEILKNHPYLADMFVEKGCSNGTFMLDNIQYFEKILTKQNRKLLGPEYYELIGKIDTKKSLQELCQTVDSPDTFRRKALEIIYNSNNHTIAFGEEMVETESSFLVHLLSGRQYYCSESEFNKMAKMLAEKNSRKGGLYYNKIAEGILKQKPELKAVISQFEVYCGQINGLEPTMKVQKIKEFFKQLAKDGILPEKIKLHTIIPDENAFADVRNTLFLQTNKTRIHSTSVSNKSINKVKTKLNDVLRSKYCGMPDYMSQIPKECSSEEVKKILLQMFEDSKFFSRVSTCEIRYGKNFAFAKMMSDLSRQSSKAISDGESFENVIKIISSGYSKETSINTGRTNRINKSGVYRGDSTRPPKYFEGHRVDEYVTGYGLEGTDDGYRAYVKRLNKNLSNRVSPYDNFVLTKRSGSDELMLHPYHEEVPQNMKIISERYKIFQNLVNEYKKSGTLTPEQRQQADNIISEIYYLMSNTCPFWRGSNGINDVLMRSQYSALGINMPHVKKGIGLDLEAFCFELKDYQKNWRAFFEGGGSIKPVRYKPAATSSSLIKLDDFSIARAKESVEEGLMRKEFMDNVTNASSIEECNELIKSATTRLEYLYASMRIPKK